MTTIERYLSVKKIFWDYEFSQEELQDLLTGKIQKAGHLDKTGLYSRLLSSMHWYAILDIVGNDHVEEVLSDSVLSRIHSRDLKRKYAVAQRILFQ
jgi:hypothetical protein